MPIDASIQDQVQATIQEMLSEAVEGFGRAFGFNCDMEILNTKSDQLSVAKASLDVEGLALTMQAGDSGFLFVIIQQGDLIPEWCKKPDASGESRLMTLSQELGMTLVPEDYMPEDFSACYTASIAEACQAAVLPEDFSRVDMRLFADGIETKAFLAWPVNAPMNLKQAALNKEEEPEPIPVSAPPLPGAVPTMAHPAFASIPEDFESSVGRLPIFTRSLLQIQIPMAVRVVSTMKPIGKLLEIGPGSILQFDKNCEEPLVLEANNEPIAEGTAVRAGDKFGLQITKILMPRERFWTVQPGKNAS